MSNEDKLHRAFMVGYAIAVANLMRLHDQDTMARDVLAAIGGVDALKGCGVPKQDMDILRKLSKTPEPR